MSDDLRELVAHLLEGERQLASKQGEVQRTRQADLRLVRHLFKAMDHRQAGQLTASDFARGVRKALPKGSHLLKSQKLMDLFDEVLDAYAESREADTISYDVFCKLLMTSTGHTSQTFGLGRIAALIERQAAPGRLVNDLYHAFSQYDRLNDGFIRAGDLRDLLDRAGFSPPLSAKNIEDVIEAMSDVTHVENRDTAQDDRRGHRHATSERPRHAGRLYYRDVLSFMLRFCQERKQGDDQLVAHVHKEVRLLPSSVRRDLIDGFRQQEGRQESSEASAPGAGRLTPRRVVSVLQRHGIQVHLRDLQRIAASDLAGDGCVDWEGLVGMKKKKAANREETQRGGALERSGSGESGTRGRERHQPRGLGSDRPSRVGRRR